MSQLLKKTVQSDMPKKDAGFIIENIREIGAENRVSSPVGFIDTAADALRVGDIAGSGI